MVAVSAMAVASMQAELRLGSPRLKIARMPSAAGLPILYASWMDQLLGASIPAETSATCETCAMAPEDQDAGPGFLPTLKCCTFMPRLSNFLVGGILLDRDPEMAAGRASIEARLSNSAAVTPLGLISNDAYQALYDAPGTFGNDARLLCPHYVNERGGICSIWRHRESTCTTYYCKFVRGAVGASFWAQLKELLRLAEQSLSSWCIAQLGLRAGSEWGDWRGREREFFCECARLVERLEWHDIVGIGGRELQAQAELTRTAFGRLIDSADPERPTATLVQITPRGTGHVRLSTYSGMDALDVPSELVEALSYFDGRPMAAALSDIEQHEQLVIHPSLVRKLVDFGVLTDVARPA
jgi:hypothetical protein